MAPKSQLVLKFFQLLSENAVQMMKGLSEHSVGDSALIIKIIIKVLFHRIIESQSGLGWKGA